MVVIRLGVSLLSSVSKAIRGRVMVGFVVCWHLSVNTIRGRIMVEFNFVVVRQ